MSGRTTLQTGMVLAVIVLLVATGGATVAAAGTVTVSDVTVSGPAVVADGDRPSVAGWRAMNLTASVTTGTDTYDVCFERTGTAASSVLDCRRITGTNATEDVTVQLESLPKNATGSQDLTVTVRPATATNATADPLATGSTTVRVLAAGDDDDDDGLTNRVELDTGTAVSVADTDGDSLNDGPEVNTHETDPTNTDTDGDGLADGVEVTDQSTNPTESDTDGDGLVDGVEVTTHGTDPTSTDTDGDGLDDGVEVADYQTAPTDTDTDGDGLDDGPEVNVHETAPTRSDTDGDGLDDAAEVEQYGTNPTKTDTDGDGLADGREVEQYGTDPTRADTDGDGVDDAAEATTGEGPSSERTGPVGTFSVSPRIVVAVLVGVSLALGVGFVWMRRPLWPIRSSDNRSQADTAVAGVDDVSDESGAETTTPTEPHLTEVITDEKRIHGVVRDHDGQVRQSVVVEETGWSKSKVSRVLSRMSDDGAVTKISLGRENLITHPDSVPDGAASPFDPTDTE